ncbi:glycosyltransferase family 2 protein [Undibacterium sp.]|jgi:biofilm PGA synthesis N-glycosyltransferase PgaC|uniref:glycosyltransferase n=1 Tax=Undibacterium sp. TaxID=1914977 RepID=UPI00272FE7AA|nr:glycosyltransferase family A protein [Undibacterium sp.]MDP1977094.1 glycosyltransferase family A protein [Undibacterium sp.]
MSSLSTQPAQPSAAPATVVPLVIIAPVRDEADLIKLTLDSMVAQTVKPVEWIIVDDGSQDGTADIVREYADKYPFIRLVQRPDRGFRKVGGGVVAAFKFGITQIAHQDYEYIAKLDGDMSFGPRYLECMFEQFALEPKLAAVSGKVFREEEGQKIEEIIIDEHVAGQFKLYRRTAFEEIGGFVEEVLWDGIDVHTARMKGWTTRSFLHPDAILMHHRLMGSSDKNVYRGRLRWGRGIWFMGYHPLYALASGVFRMREKPFVIGGLLIIAGYLGAAIKRAPRYDNMEFRQHLHRWQLGQIKKLFSGQKN